MNFESAIESPCGKFCDYVTVFTPVAVLGVFLISRTYLKLDTYAVSAFAYFYLPQCYKAWRCIAQWWTDWHWFRIAIHRMQEAELYECIFTFVSDIVVDNRQCISANAVLKYDRQQGVKALVLQNEGNTSFGTRLRLENKSGRSCSVCVEYDQGEHICVGKDRTMQQNSCLTLWITPRTEETWKLVKEWMSSCLESSRKQVADRLDVFTLQQTSTDWIPEWKFSNSRALKSCGGKGLNYYISRPECELIYRDAKTFIDDILCCYHVYGASGSGKSEFAAWLAGMLHVPLYILNLTCPGLDDSRLLSIAGYAGFRHSDPVVLLVDEFQAVYQKLTSSDATMRVTLEGLHAFMSSAGSLQNGVLLLCGLDDGSSFDLPTSRRIHHSIKLTPFTPEQLCTMAVHFLQSKTPDVNWPDEINEVVVHILHASLAKSLSTIDEMREFIRGRLTTTKDQASVHENQWKEFLAVLFADPLREKEQVAVCNETRLKRLRT